MNTLAGSTIPDEIIPIFAISSGLIFGIIWLICATVSGTRERTAKEESRREIAAYIAEGTMTAEQGERLMAAGEGERKCGIGSIGGEGKSAQAPRRA